MDVITIDINNYKPHPMNPNTHPDAQLTELQGSLSQFGQYKNVVVWKDYILAGHGLIEAARRAGMETLDAVDLSHLPEEQALALLVADNRLPELAVMDEAGLAEIIKGMTRPEDIPGVDQAYIDELLGKTDNVPYPNEKTLDKPFDMIHVLVSIPTGKYHLIAGIISQIETVPEAEIITGGN